MTKKNGKRKLETAGQSVVDWEEEDIFPDQVTNEMETMWEIPQIFHFLQLTKDALNIPHLSMYEMERMFLIPRASKQLANIMTSLLSSPITKAKLRKVPSMPYEFWTNILAHKVEGWFKLYEVKHRNAVKVLESIGVEPDFWNIFPQPPLIDGKDFEELSLKQKVWLLKTTCDTVMHTKKTVQEKLFKQPVEDQIETVLGTDRYGARYIYFPQFLNSDLRVYKHSMDNKILSTVKPVQPKFNTSLNNNVKQPNKVTKKKIKCRRRKARWSNGLLGRPKRSVNKCDEKRSPDSKYGSDSATGSLTNDDTNLSIISTSSNNNHIGFHTINRTRSRSLSKTSEVSSTSVETVYRSTRSSGYDTNSSTDTDTDTDGKVAQKMFKGFANTSTSKYKIEIISGILNELKSEVEEDKILENEVSSTISSQETLESLSSKQYLNTAISHTEECTERPSESLSSSSKTDDEKLNEIINAEGTKLNRTNSNRFPVKKNLQQHCLISKSDDEKLSENRTNSNSSKKGNKDHLRSNENDCEDTNSASIKKKKLTHEKVVEYMEVTENTKERQRKLQTSNDKDIEQLENEKTCSTKKDIEDEIFLSDKLCLYETQDEFDMESSDEDDSSLIELRYRLQREAMHSNFGWNDNVEIGYNFRRMKDEKTTEWQKYITNFNELLLELKVSKFQLVSDSVQSLRGLISNFTTKSGNPGTSTNNDMSLPSCEEKLVVKLKELLSTVEEIEPSLKDSIRKARGRLQKEWTNFKQGNVEDQDSSGEGGLNSNWWVLGSQGCPRPANGDSTVQTISQSTLSPLGTENHSHKCDEQPETQVKNTEQNKCRKQESTEEQRENAKGKDHRKNETEEEEEEEERNEQSTRAAENTDKKYNKEEEEQTRRVLRARGVSSYTEQFYSDDEIEENGMEEWTDIEAVYATPGAQANTPSSHSAPKIKHPDDRTEQEDSDQDWILPGSRRRKNKRPSANRRLKSFQHKLQNMITDAVQEAVDLGESIPDNINVNKDMPIYTERTTPPMNVQNERQTPDSSTERSKVREDHCFSEIVPSTQSVYKVEPVDSVHSELDIKDEGPIYDSAPNQLENNYGTNTPQNYVMVKADNNPVNYYVMQPNLGASVVQSNTIVQSNPVISSIIPSIQPGYYVQGTPNYFISNSQPNFVAPPAHLQSQGLQMITPQFVSAPHGYVPNVMSTPQTHPGYMTMQVPRGQSVYQEMPPTSPLQNQTTRAPIRYSQNRYQQPRQNYPHPNGAVIRSNIPVRGNLRRQLNAKCMRNTTPRQRLGAPKVQNLRHNTPSDNTTQKTTSLIVLSDSDDEIEMIITEAATPQNEENTVKTSTQRTDNHTKRKQTTTFEDTEISPKSVISPQIIERMNQGGISITPVKPTPAQNSNTQLVVVVNETGSHYALALPNGSKLILTPEQVAQIRASNGGKLVL